MANSSQLSHNPSSSKHQKLSPKENSDDWISKLPDSVLCHILSFLPTNTAVSTSILSKRWRFLWTCVLNLDFDAKEIFRYRRNMNLGDIVDKVLRSRRRDCAIKRFRLRCSLIDWDANYNDTWISVAVERNIEEFDLQLYSILEKFEIPRRLFYCTTLVVLKLTGSDVIMDVPSSVHLPKLKVLHLMGVYYKENQSPRNLLEGCPVLEELVVQRDVGKDNILEYEINAPSLRSLTVLYWGNDMEHRNMPAQVTKVHLKNLCGLVEAKINAYSSNHLFWEDYKDSVDVLRAVHNVIFLELWQRTMRAFRFDSSDNFPTFHNLVRLKLNGFCCFWGMLVKLLQNSPCLEHLTLAKPSPHKNPENCECRYSSERWMQPPSVPMCLSSRLTTFCFKHGFTGLEDDIEFVRFIVENSLVLENVTIRCWPILDLEVVQQKIEMFRKSSKKCQLKFE